MDFDTIGLIGAALLVYAVVGGVFVACNHHKRYALYLWGIGGIFAVLVFVSWLFIHSLVFEVGLHIGFWTWAVNRLVRMRPRSGIAGTPPNPRHIVEWP